MREGDRAGLIAAQARMPGVVRDWREGAEYRALVRTFADCPLDSAEPAADRAERLFADAGWARALLAPLVEALAGDPFFEPPLRANRDAAATGVAIFDCPAVSIAANVTSAVALRRLPPSASIVFSGLVTVTRYEKAGGASLRRWWAAPVAADFSAAGCLPCTPLAAVTLADGEVRRADGRVEAQLFDSASSDMVAFTATIRAGADPLMREHRVADGALVRIASADRGASRTEMLLAFLRHAGRADAGPRFAEASRDAAFHTRWAAMREWLALDARAALPRLAEMAAGDANAEVRNAATRTLPLVEAACLA